jgi:hypothetical protein
MWRQRFGNDLQLVSSHNIMPCAFSQILSLSSVGPRRFWKESARRSKSSPDPPGCSPSPGPPDCLSTPGMPSIGPPAASTSWAAVHDPMTYNTSDGCDPMKRCGTFEEMAGLCAFIVSPECSFTTGFCFDATGSRSTHWTPPGTLLELEHARGWGARAASFVTVGPYRRYAYRRFLKRTLFYY